MRTIWKYELQLTDEPQPIRTTAKSDVNLIAAQNGKLYLWMQFDSEAEPLTRKFVVHGTGHEIPREEEWQGSCIMPPFVWHIYEVPQPEEDKHDRT